MTISFTRTREQLSRMVLKKLQVMGAADSDNSTDMTDIYEAIDIRLKEIHTLGIFWRKVAPLGVSASTDGSANSVSFTVDILFPISLHVTDSSSDYKIDIITPKQYAAISDKTDTGTPTKAVWDGSAHFTFWPVADASMSVNLIYESIASDTAAATAPDVDTAMLRALRDMVCYDVGDEFNQSEQRMQRFEREAKMAELRIRKLTVPRTDPQPVPVDDWYDENKMDNNYYTE